MEEIIIPTGTAILESRLKVTSNGKIPAFDPNSAGCHDGNILTIDSSTYSSSETDGDFVLFLGVVNESEQGYLAYASYCKVHASNKRPFAGFAVFNEPFVSYDDGDIRAQIATFVHEVLHALYFHPGLFAEFPANAAGEEVLFQDAESKWFLRGDALKAKAKEHFGCNSISKCRNFL